MDLKDYIPLKGSDSNFWYRAKLNLISFLLRNIDNKSGNAKILDLGCGTGFEIDELLRFGDVSALDISKEALDRIEARPGLTLLCADIEKHCLEKDKYDCVCCFDLLEHLKEDGQALKNIFNSLKKGGFLVFTVPAFPSLYSSHDLALGHYRRYSRKEIRGKVKAAGFTINKTGYWNFIFFIFEAAVRILKNLFLVRLLGKKKFNSDMASYPKVINSFLFSILNLEVVLIRNKFTFPFGLTIYGIAKK
ncbi:MAG: class I SAM-dependent methyltransferase [Patescibacteria group bacterium]|jgi:SAM-dependent methyltransferase